jgi:hypothetical protein
LPASSVWRGPEVHLYRLVDAESDGCGSGKSAALQLIGQPVFPGIILLFVAHWMNAASRKNDWSRPEKSQRTQAAKNKTAIVALELRHLM